MPNEPGCLHKAAKIIKSHGGNIHRADYDRRIDPHIVFFEVEVRENDYREILQELAEIGYLQTTLSTPKFLKFNVFLDNKPGALFDLLNYITAARANIAFMDFDDKSEQPSLLTLGMTLEQSQLVDSLLHELKARYRIEVLEFDETGMRLDDTVFYLRFAQQIRQIIGDAEEDFLLKLLHDSNHIAQELTRLGMEPREAFNSIVETGRMLKSTTGSNFKAEVQEISLEEGTKLFCFQPQCGGNVFLLASVEDKIMIDSGFGIYHDDIAQMLKSFGLGDGSDISRIYISHADADHSGGAGLYSGVSYMHPKSLGIVREMNRAYGSRKEKSILEEAYTKLINLFSSFSPPAEPKLLPTEVKGRMGAFNIIDDFQFNGKTFRVLEGLGGHLEGHLFFLCEDYNLLFTGDCLINFASLSEERQHFASLAKILMTSVNVDSEKASAERKGLIELAQEIQRRKECQCILCCGHGDISCLSDGALVSLGRSVSYSASK